MTQHATDVERLRAAARIATTLDLNRISDEARALADRVAGGQFYVAVVGQFKRGKSTLIDALLNDPILPAAVVPVTALPTIVRYGVERSARVRVRATEQEPEADPDWRVIPPEDLAHCVSEELNPEYAKGVLGVEVFEPSALLASGMCLVDTPGIGSVFEGNTAATRGFVPHIDAAIVVIGADPPVTGDELDLIADVGRQVSHLLFVLNKADRVTERERDEATAFARTVVERRLGRHIDHIFQVSASERLENRGPSRDWDAFVSALEALVAASGRQLARESGQRGLKRIMQVLIATTRERRAALLRPISENEQRLGTIERVIADGTRAIGDLAALSTAANQRLAQQFVNARTTFVAAALPDAQADLTERLASIRGRFGPRLRRRVLHEAQSVAREILEPWLVDQQHVADTAYRESMERFIGYAQSLLDRLADSDVPELEQLRTAVEQTEGGLRAQSAFSFNEVIHVAEPASPLRFLADVALGLIARGAFERDAEAFLRWLLEMNATRVESNVTQRVVESQRGLERDLRLLLTDARARAERALAGANAAQLAGQIAVTDALRSLDQVEHDLARLQANR